MIIKFKGRTIEVDGKVLGEITGWRDPSGKHHKPYIITLIDGTIIQQFAYCDDARKHCKHSLTDKFQSLLGGQQ